MNQTNPIPPVGRWLRLAEGAARLGLPPRVLRTSIEAGTAAVRAQRLGARGMLYVAEGDLEQFALQLQRGGVR